MAVVPETPVLTVTLAATAPPVPVVVAGGLLVPYATTGTPVGTAVRPTPAVPRVPVVTLDRRLAAPFPFLHAVADAPSATDVVLVVAEEVASAMEGATPRLPVPARTGDVPVPTAAVEVAPPIPFQGARPASGRPVEVPPVRRLAACPIPNDSLEAL